MNPEQQNEQQTLEINTTTPGLHNYKQTTNVKTSTDIGQIQVIYTNRLFPGERINSLRFKNLQRELTPLHPTLDAAYFDLFAFEIPTRLLRLPIQYNPDNLPYQLAPADLRYLITKNELPDDKREQYSLFPETFEPIPNLLKKFGIGQSPLEFGNLAYMLRNQANFNLEYLLAYKKIYFDYFRDKRFEPTTLENIIDFINNNFNTFNGNTGIPTPIWDETRANDKDPQFGKKIEIYRYYLRYLNSINIANTSNDILETLQLEQYNTDMNSGTNTTSFEGAYYNLFKNYIDNMKLFNNIEYATQKDLLISIYNKNNGDKTNAQLLGHERFYQTVTQVVNQSKGTTKSEALGEVGGLSVTYNEGQLINNFEANEECIIMVLAVPNYKTTFRNYIDSDQWFVNNETNIINGSNLGVVEQFNPQFTDLQIPLYAAEFLNSSDRPPVNLVIGYRKPFNYLRKQHDIICGDMRDYWKSWTFGRDLVLLDDQQNPKFEFSNFKTDKKPFKDTLVSTTQDSFIGEYEFALDVDRHIQPDFVIKDTIIKGNKL